MDETELPENSAVGEELRQAREAKGLSLEDVATQTRIPLRHLQSLEAGDWARLPAPTYTIGFAKSYASAVGLDRMDIGDQLRAEMGGYRSDIGTQEVFQPVDPARTMPRWVILGAVAAVIVLVLLFTWFRNLSLSGPAAAPTAAVPPPAAAVAPPAGRSQPQELAPAANGPVVLTAIAPAWVRVTDHGKTLFEGMMQPGQTYQVPQTATAPMLRAGAPEALRVTVGNAVAPPVGPPGKVASDVSLLGPDLMKGGKGAAAGATAAPTEPTTNAAAP